MRATWFTYSKRAAYSTAIALTSVLAGPSPAAAQAPSPAAYATPVAKDMRVVGEHPVDGRINYWPTVHQMGSRWIAFVGHQAGNAVSSLTGQNEPNGVSILDVTTPASPKLLHHIPGPPAPERSGAEHVRVCNGRDLPQGDASKVYLLRSYGRIGHQLWDVTTPEKPAFIADVASSLTGTHKSWWDCASGMAYVVGGPAGWPGNVIMIYDISNPSAVKHVRDYGLPGSEPGGAGDARQTIHGPIARGKRLYAAWGTSSNGVIQILDIDKLLKGDPTKKDPLAPTRENLLYPEVGRLPMPTFWGGHTTYPVLGMTVPQYAHDGRGQVRDYLVAISEATGSNCNGYQHMGWLVDITDEAHPFPVSTLATPEVEGSVSWCLSGGRFGTHGSNESFHPDYYRKIVFVSYFNAGVRAFDIRDPLRPKEVASFVPATTNKTIESCAGGGGGRGGAAAPAPTNCRKAIQTNNVDIDGRGLIYIVDRAGTGIHILELTGEARKIVDAR